MEIINVLVVDDSAFMRKMISEILNASPQINVVGTARDGKDALNKITNLKPDVITLDVEMPNMDGLSTLERIMKECPLPVIMLSSLTKKGTEKTIQSIALGAIDFIAKPSGSISLDIKRIEKEIVSKVLVASKTPIHTLTRNFSDQYTPEPIVMNRQSQKSVVAIGTSTGGPRALQQVLTKLPSNFPAPIVIVQHMPKGFTKSLAERLNSLSNIQVKEATNGEVLVKGTAYIAPGGSHLQVKQMGRSIVAHVFEEEARNGHQPSVDVLFESIAAQKLFQPYVVIMTGMGSDGSSGLRVIKSKWQDAVIISESRKTSVVYGMPQAAVQTKLVDYIVDLDDISNVLINKFNA